MERLTQLDLTERLENLSSSSENGSFATSPVIMLEETLWGLKNGIYVPLGELQLPVQLAGRRDEEENYLTHQIATAFNHSFFEGNIPESKDGYIMRPYSDGWADRREGYYANESLVIGAEQDSDSGISARKFVEKHVSKYFDLLGKRSKLDEEAKEFLARSFSKY